MSIERHAILIGNAARSDEPQLNVDVAQLRKNMADVSGRLAALGKWAFNVTNLVNEDHQDVLAELRKCAIRVAKRMKDIDDDESCLLIYYFGHAVQRNNDLHFVFRDSQTSTPSTMLSFGDTVKLVSGYNIDRIVAVIDCCFAGSATYPIHVEGSDRFAVVASTDGLSRAEVRPGSSPFGVFSRVFFENLRDMDATRNGSNQVTLGSLFARVESILHDEGYEQKPKLIDGGLQSLVLTEANPEPVVDPRYSENAPLRSYYRKLYWLCDYFRTRASASADDVYKRIKAEKPAEFMTPVTRNGSTVYEPIKRATFDAYVQQALDLGVVHEEKSLLGLTAKGKSLMANDGRAFNVEIRKRIDDRFEVFEFSYTKLDATIRGLLGRREVPAEDSIFFAARRYHRLLMRTKEFGVLLDLLTYAGYLRYTPRRTYFPY